MKQYKRNYHTKGVLNYYQDGGYAPNNFFNRLFNRNGILEQQIRNEYGALKKIPLRKMHVDYAHDDDATTLEQLHHNPEYIGPGEGLQFEQAGNINIPRGKMLVNDDPANPRFVSVNYPGQYTTLINPVGLSKQNIKAIASNDFVSHALHGDPVYDRLNQQLGNMLVQKYGEQMVQNNGGADAYIRGLISDDPEYKSYQDEMAFIPQAFKDGIVNYIKSAKAPSFQQGGQQNVPVPAFLLNPSLPPQPVTDPKAFARLYGIDSRPAGDISDTFHLPSRDLLEQRVQDSLTRKPVVPSAVAPKEQPKKKPIAPPPLPVNNNPVNSDIATYYNVPTPEKFATDTQVAANEQGRLKSDLMRLGYDDYHANYFASQGKDKMLPTVQQQLDDQAVKDYRVRNHPDYDPNKPVEDQQNLDYDNSLRARLLRGRNMLVDTGNPVTDLIAQTVTAPGKSFANLTVDPYKQYINPGFVTGLANLGNDLMTVFPSGMEQLKAGLTNRLVDTGVPESTLLLGKKLSDPVGAPAIRANLIDKFKDIGKDKLSELVYGEKTDDAWNEALNNESSMPPTNMYQLGGEQNIPAPAFLLNPSLPPQAITDPKAFARLYGIDSRPAGDIADSFHLPSRDLLEQRVQNAMTKKPAATNAAAAKEQPKKQPPPLPSTTNPTNSDIASYYNVPTPEKLDMYEQAVIAQQDRLKQDLMRLGYNENQANYFASKGKDKMLPTVQQQLDDQAVTDYRVRNHPDYDPSKPVEDQQNLDYDNSLRARLLRGRNMLVDTGNPVTNLIAQTITAPGKSFVNLTMDADKQYVKPGLAQGVTNLGNDLMTLFPAVGDQAAAAIVERAPAWAQGYLANPVAQGAEDLARWYVPKGAYSGTINQYLPEHGAFLRDLDQNLSRGIPFKAAVQSAYRPIKGDNLSGMSLLNDETPLQVYRGVKQQQEKLPLGRMWSNSSYSTDSYPLMLDHISKRLDPEKYQIIPTYDHSPLNSFGFKSNDLLEALPDNLKSDFKGEIEKLNSYKDTERNLQKQLSSTEDQKVKSDIQAALKKNSFEADVSKESIRFELNKLMEDDPSIRGQLLEGYNDRIRKINQQYGINMPLAKEKEDPFSSSSAEIMVPQFNIYKKDPNTYNRLFNLSQRIGIRKPLLPSFESLADRARQALLGRRSPELGIAEGLVDPPAAFNEESRFLPSDFDEDIGFRRDWRYTPRQSTTNVTMSQDLLNIIERYANRRNEIINSSGTNPRILGTMDEASWRNLYNSTQPPSPPPSLPPNLKRGGFVRNSYSFGGRVPALPFIFYKYTL